MSDLHLTPTQKSNATLLPWHFGIVGITLASLAVLSYLASSVTVVDFYCGVNALTGSVVLSVFCVLSLTCAIYRPFASSFESGLLHSINVVSQLIAKISAPLFRDVTPPFKRDQKNNLNVMRLIFALFVVYSHMHAFFLYSYPIPTFGGTPLGTLAVDSFFFISGYLLAGSWLRNPDVVNFALNRVLRIYPGYIVAFFVSLYLASIFGGQPFTVLSCVMHYHGLLGKLLQLHYPTWYAYLNTQQKYTLNGSMWTLPYEFGCYVSLIFAGLCGLLRYRRIVLLYAGVLLWQFNTVMSGDAGVRLTLFFVLGVVFLVYSDKLKPSKWIVLSVVCLIACEQIFHITLLKQPLLLFSLPYLINIVGFHLKPVKWISADLSYGTYIYAWPIQQAFGYQMHRLSPIRSIVYCTSATLVCAFISWYVIEKPFLGLKNKIGIRRSIRTEYAYNWITLGERPSIKTLPYQLSHEPILQSRSSD